jgi:quaternary ammonium compound-resistance protein SugE
MIASFGMLLMAMKSLPLGTAWSIWTAVGDIGAVGILVLGEGASPMRILTAILIVCGLVLMKLSS